MATGQTSSIKEQTPLKVVVLLEQTEKWTAEEQPDVAQLVELLVQEGEVL